MKEKLTWIAKNILFGFLFAMGVFAAITAKENIKGYNWHDRPNCIPYEQESNELEIVGYIPILDQKEFKYSFKIKNNTNQPYSRVKVVLNVYKNDYLVAECSSTVTNLIASEERDVVSGCYDLIPENITNEYRFTANVTSYQN
ncbi:MAG: hypothetical protein P8045_08970 [Candidatus Thiodiazotropha sp.]